MGLTEVLAIDFEPAARNQIASLEMRIGLLRVRLAVAIDGT